MARRFRKKDGLHVVMIPGVGSLSGDRVLEGDEWAKFCPSVLVEILDSTPAKPKQILTEVPKLPPSEALLEEELMSDVKDEKKSPPPKGKK